MRFVAAIAGVGVLAVIAAAGSACRDDGTDSRVDVKLDNYSVTSSQAEVPAGRVTFTATNVHATDVHELAVLEKRPDGSLKNLGEIEDLGAGKDGTVTISLKKGEYVLACLIAIGQAGSKVDHFTAGMKTDFRVN